MNLGGLAVLLLVLCGGVFAIALIASDANMTAPVDSAGATTPILDNLTRDNVTGKSPVAVNLATGIVLIVGCVIMFSVIVYFVGARHPYRGRYQ